MLLTTTTTKKGRINVHADGEYMFTVPAFVWYRSTLSGQKEADAEALDALRAEGLAYDAYEKGLRLLGNRAHGTAELRRKLRLDYPAEAAEAAVEKLSEAGLLNDEAYAEALAEELSRRKHWAPERILRELTQRGIDAGTAKNAAFGLDINKKQGIIDIITKMHLPQHPTKKDADRLIRRLLSAGYSMHEIREVISFSEENEIDEQ